MQKPCSSSSQVHLARYVPQFDGLRAVAVTLVLFYHLRLPGFLNGFVGVQMFFVLSGFLITGILLDTVFFPKYLQTFFVRRILRIFPIYYLVLFVVAGIWFIQSKPLALPQFVANLFYCQNFTLGLANFQVEFPDILGHTWSLAVEEQFYLLWPFLILALQTPRRVFAASALFFVFGTVARYWMAHYFQGNFICWMALPPNLDGLGLGGAIAASCRMDHPLPPSWRRAAGLAVATLVAYLIAGRALDLDFPWARELCLSEPAGRLFILWITLTFGLLLSACLDRDFPVNRLLSSAPFTGIGRISYGLYLYHIPMYRIVDAHFGVFYLFGSLHSIRFFKLLFSLGVAALSYVTIERFFLSLKDRFTYQKLSNELKDS